MKRIISLALIICLGLVTTVFAKDFESQQMRLSNTSQDFESDVTLQGEAEYTPGGKLITAPFEQEYTYPYAFNALIFNGVNPSMSDEEFFQGVDKSQVIDANTASDEVANQYRLVRLPGTMDLKGDGVTKTFIKFNDEQELIRWRYVYKTPGFEISYEKLNQTEYNLTSNMGGMAVIEYLAKSKLGKYYTFYASYNSTLQVTTGNGYTFIGGQDYRNEIKAGYNRAWTAMFNGRPYKVEISDPSKAYFLINGEKANVAYNPPADDIDGCYINVYGSNPGYFNVTAYYKDATGREIATAIAYCVSTGV